MKIYDFDIKKGIYSFEFKDLTTEIHAHPVVEIIMATKGTFNLSYQHQKTKDLVFAVVDANIKHQVSSKNCVVKLLMLESNNLALGNFLNHLDIEFVAGCFLTKEFPSRKIALKRILEFSQKNNLKRPKDRRVEECIAIMENGDLEYTNLITSLTSQVHLSESRLSHLFKEHIGVSLKKYLVWDRLRKTIQYHLIEKKNLTAASVQNGFFDQAHLSNSFKNVLGVSPSKAYNSRTLQF